MDNDQVLLELLARLTEAAEGINAEAAQLVNTLERMVVAMEGQYAPDTDTKSKE